MKSKTLYIIQNDPEVPPGNITDTLGSHGVSFRTLHPYAGDPLPELSDCAALIVLGGSMGANDDLRHPFLTPLKALIRNAVLAGTPYLGICLGGQLLAEALETAVVSHRWEEMGTLPVPLVPERGADPLFAGIDSPFISFQWHHDSFDLPSGATLLASSGVCPHQAFRAGKSAWGLQFHPEVTEAIIRSWCAWNRETGSRADELVADFRQHHLAYLRTAETVWTNFLQQAGLLKIVTP